MIMEKLVLLRAFCKVQTCIFLNMDESKVYLNIGVALTSHEALLVRRKWLKYAAWIHGFLFKNVFSLVKGGDMWFLSPWEIKKLRMVILRSFPSGNELCMFVSAKQNKFNNKTPFLSYKHWNYFVKEREREREIADHLWFHDAYHSTKLLWFAVKMIRPACWPISRTRSCVTASVPNLWFCGCLWGPKKCFTQPILQI